VALRAALISGTELAANSPYLQLGFYFHWLLVSLRLLRGLDYASVLLSPVEWVGSKAVRPFSEFSHFHALG
jgi:hypothetical protein